MRRRDCAVAGAVLGLLFVPTSAGASCQSTWCYEQHREYEEEWLGRRRDEALANPRDEEKWSATYSLLERAADRRRGIAAFRARFDWAPQPALDRWPALERQVAAERGAWLALWREADPDGSDVQCRTAERNPNAESALEDLKAASLRHPDDEKLVRCLVWTATRAGRPEVGLAAAQDLVERHREDPETWSVLVGAASSAHDAAMELAALEAIAELEPGKPWSRLAVLQALKKADAGTDLEETFARYTAEAAGAAALEPLCGVFVRETARVEACYRAVLATDGGGELSQADRSAVKSARQGLLVRVAYAKDLSEVERLNLASPAEEALGGWSTALDVLKTDACPAFLRDVESGRLSAAVRDQPTRWPLFSLARSLETCHATETAHDLVDATGIGARSLPLGDRLALISRRDADERLAAHPSDVDAQAGLDQAAYSLAPRERIAYLFGRLQAKPDYFRLRQQLQKALTELAESGHADEAVASAAQALALYPADLDWSLQIAFFDLRWKDDGAARSLAQDVLRSPTAVPRQRDEAEFLLARLELRAGRFAEASERLERYFLDRVRYEGCLEDADCDEAMALDLLAGLDRKRLTSYLARRAEAIAYFRTVIAPATEIGYGRMMQRPWPETQWTRTLVAAPACRQDDTLARLRSVHAWSRPVRLRAAAKLPACPPAFGDLEKALDRAAPERVWAKLTRID